MEEMHKLYDAVSSLDKPAATAIIEDGFDLDTRDLSGNTLLHSVIVNEQPREVIELVVELGFDINSLNKRNWSPLFVMRKYLVVNEPNKALHKWLMGKGALSVPDKNGEKWS